MILYLQFHATIPTHSQLDEEENLASPSARRGQKIPNALHGEGPNHQLKQATLTNMEALLGLAGGPLHIGA